MNKKVALIAFASFLGVIPLSQAADPDAASPNLRPQSVEGLPRPQTLEGEVLRFEGNYYVVKDMEASPPLHGYDHKDRWKSVTRRQDCGSHSGDPRGCRAIRDLYQQIG